MGDLNAGRVELWRNLALTAVGLGFGAWSFVVSEGTDRIVAGQQRIETRLDGLERRLDASEKDLAVIELTLADRPPRWLLERVERLEKAAGQ